MRNKTVNKCFFAITYRRKIFKYFKRSSLYRTFFMDEDKIELLFTGKSALSVNSLS